VGIQKNNEVNQPRGQCLTQKARIINYLEKHGKIDRKTAYEALGIFELPARICNLKDDGFEFEKKIKTGKSSYGYSFYNTEYRLKNYQKMKEQAKDEN
jgi:hypothetical protein